ncbi:MAG: FAD-binding oxidoreductase, partial [Acidobacteria bacterium]|nr:FAD-binding oxidoreductase [Acidobacteriota bacterium]
MIRQEDASGFTGYADAVFSPSTESELVGIIRQAAEQRIPLTVNGAWSGLTGGAVAQGGWAVSLEKLNGVEIHTGRAVAGGGALLRDLHAAAQSSGQFYAPDPTETAASMGGTIATNASGSRGFRYGATGRHLRRLRVAFMDGCIRDFRRGEAVDFHLPSVPLPEVRKNTAGYLLRPGMDWIDLLAGSEGTLGIVTEAEVDLLPAPGTLITGVVFFPADGTALDAVDAWRPVDGLRMLEYLDHGSLDLLRGRYDDIPRSAGAAVLFEEQPNGGEA